MRTAAEWASVTKHACVHDPSLDSPLVAPRVGGRPNAKHAYEIWPHTRPEAAKGRSDFDLLSARIMWFKVTGF